MESKFQFSRIDATVLVINTVIVGGCLVILLLGSASGPLILLTFGAFGMLAGKLGRTYFWRSSPRQLYPRSSKIHSI